MGRVTKQHRSSWFPAAPIKTRTLLHVVTLKNLFSSLDRRCRKKREERKTPGDWVAPCWLRLCLATPCMLAANCCACYSHLLTSGRVWYSDAGFFFLPRILLAILLRLLCRQNAQWWWWDCRAAGWIQTHWYEFVLQHKHRVPLASATFLHLPSL